MEKPSQHPGQMTTVIFLSRNKVNRAISREDETFHLVRCYLVYYKVNISKPNVLVQQTESLKTNDKKCC